MRARALRLVGELGKAEHTEACLQQIEHRSAEVRYWATWTAVLLGNRGEALRSMGEIGLGEGPHRWTALEVAVRGMEIYEGAAFIRRISGVPALRRAMVVAWAISAAPPRSPG